MPHCQYCHDNGTPQCDSEKCDQVRFRSDYTPDQCRSCWLFFHDPKWNLLHGGDGKVYPVEGVAVPSAPPSVLRRVWNFAHAARKHIQAGLPVTSETEAKRRLDVCESCPLFNSQHRMCLHPECGCNMDVKVTWAEQKCPIGKW